MELVELRTVASVPSVSSCDRLGKGVYAMNNWAFRYEIFKDWLISKTCGTHKMVRFTLLQLNNRRAVVRMKDSPHYCNSWGETKSTLVAMVS